MSDGQRTLSHCPGALFIQQNSGASVVGQLTGAVTVADPCWPVSFNLSGLDWPDGAVELTTNGPPGPGMPCSPAIAVQYSGHVTQGSGDGWRLAVEGEATLRCPGDTEYAATYTLAADRTSR